MFEYELSFADTWKVALPPGHLDGGTTAKEEFFMKTNVSKTKTNKKDKVYESYSGEYGGIFFDITKKKVNGKKSYIYEDSEVGRRELTKARYKNLKKNSEELYDEKNHKVIRSFLSRYE